MKDNLLQRDNMATYFDILYRRMPKVLTSSQSTKLTRDLLKIFPSNISNTFGFEYNLNINPGLSGFALAIPCKNESKINFLNFLKKNLEGKKLEGQAWKILKKIFEEWIDNSSLLYANLLGVWLEFDILARSKKVLPNVFLGPIRSDDEEIVSKLTSLLIRDKELIENVVHYTGLLPNGCQLFHIGRMFARKSSSIRLVAKGFNKENLLTYLSKIGWKGDRNFVGIVEDIPEDVNRILINFEINRNVKPNIGIEFSFKPDRFHWDKRWSFFLEWLSRRDLIRRDIAKSLLTFPGLDVVKSPKNPHYETILVSYIGHIKIVYIDPKKYLIKSYLGIRIYQPWKLLKSHPSTF